MPLHLIPECRYNGISRIKFGFIRLMTMARP